MKPNSSVTCTWSASTAGSGTLSAYELRYTVDNGVNYTTISNNIGADVKSYTFTPQTIDGQQVIVQIRARNSYDKYSSWNDFPTITIYTDGMSVGKHNNTLRHLRAYAKVGDSMEKINYIKVKVGGIVYNIEQLTPPVTPP